MNRATQNRIRKLEREANMNSLQHLTDEELDARITESLRGLTAEYDSLEAAIEAYAASGVPEFEGLAVQLRADLPSLRERLSAA